MGNLSEDEGDGPSLMVIVGSSDGDTHCQGIDVHVHDGNLLDVDAHCQGVDGDLQYVALKMIFRVLI